MVSGADKVTLDDGFCYPSIPALMHCTHPYLLIRYLLALDSPSVPHKFWSTGTVRLRMHLKFPEIQNLSVLRNRIL